MKHVAALIALFLPALASAADISGKADVIDGGTIVIGGQRILLNGIAAPNFWQTCNAGNNASWFCGQEGAFARADAIGRTWMDCDLRDAGTLKRVAAVCKVRGPKGRNLGAWMVAKGWPSRSTAHLTKL